MTSDGAQTLLVAGDVLENIKMFSKFVTATHCERMAGGTKKRRLAHLLSCRVIVTVITSHVCMIRLSVVKPTWLNQLKQE